MTVQQKKIIKDPLIMGILFGMALMFGLLYYIPQKVEIENLLFTKYAENIFKIIFAAIAGCIIGVERENKNRPAGLRTHALVAIGATVVMIIPIELGKYYNNISRMDPTRLGAQVISGIGFLGAGTIIRDGVTVKGLTTAASLWVVGTIGLAIGSGLYGVSIISTMTAFFILKGLGGLERRHMMKEANLQIVIVTKDRPGQIGYIGEKLGKYGIKIIRMDIIENEENQEGEENQEDKEDKEDNLINIMLFLKVSFHINQLELLRELEKIPEVLSIDIKK